MRCFTALETALKNHLKWPNSTERNKISRKFGKKGFPGCVGLIDGTLIPLSQRPKESGECFFDRKSRYSINAQVVCDHRRKILFLYTGMHGSVSDLTCFKRSSLFRRQSGGELFGRSQYILGDSGYQAMEHVVCAYKRADSSKEKEEFNMCVAKCRVVNEHCIGVLKSRWHSLKEMRIQLKTKKEFHFLVRWIILCAKLHNFVISHNDLWTEADGQIDLEPNEEGGEWTQDVDNASSNGRPTLQLTAMKYALEFNKLPGGFLTV